jgi:hypothetical protein
MKRAKFIFPLVFLLALAGSAFTRYHKSAAKEVIPAYYFDDTWATCNTTSIDDGICIVDNVGEICNQYVYEYGQFTTLYQNGIPSGCYQPFYRYY